MIVDCPRCSRRHVILERAAGTLAQCDCGHEFALTPSALETGVLKCGNCGGNPRADAQHCNYCDAHLTKLRCARCLANAIEGDVHCRACGHVLATPVHKLGPAPDHVLECPRCDSELRSIMVGDAVLDECTRCAGLWVEHAMFKDIIASQNDQSKMINALNALVPGVHEATPSGVNYGRNRPETEERFYVSCPVCKIVMDRKQFARVSGVVVDVCRAHGVWFDVDELSAIIQFVGAGGMARAEHLLNEKRVAMAKHAKTRSRPTTLDQLVDKGPIGAAADALASIVLALLK